MENTVISTIVKYDLCIGCGVCAGICPEQSLDMRFNQFGEFNPVQNNACSKNCGLCIKVCPFADGNNNEDQIGKALYGNIPRILYRPETGYYLTSYVGYASATRDRGASGGMATWLLSELMKKGFVDYVIAVVPNADPEKLFKFSIFSDPESVASSSGSVYYPVELSEVMTAIQNRPGKCAVIGLPCFVKAIRLAQKSNRKLRERIVHTIGLTCGQLKSKHFTEYTAALAEVNGIVTRVRYHRKSQEPRLSNFYFFSFTTSNSDEKRLFWDEGISEVWVNRWFTPTVCNYCDDVFAECADVVLMDAWLPEYSSDNRGTNLMLVRSNSIQKIIEEGIQSQQIILSRIPVQEIIRSQAGLIQIKKHHIGYHLYLSRKKGLNIPTKRITPKKIVCNPFVRREIELREAMRIASRSGWNGENNRKKRDLEKFQRKMNFYLVQLKNWEQFSRIFIVPMNIASFTIRKIWSFFNG